MCCFPISTAVGEIKWSYFYGLYCNKQNVTCLLNSTYFYLFVNTTQSRKLAKNAALVVSKNGPFARAGTCASVNSTSESFLWSPGGLKQHPPECQNSIRFGCWDLVLSLLIPSLQSSRTLSWHAGSWATWVPFVFSISCGVFFSCLWHSALMPCKVLCGCRCEVYFTIIDKHSYLMQALQWDTGLWIALASY